MNLQQRFLTNSACYNSNRYIQPQGIMVHSTATPGVMPERWIQLWNNQSANACVHAFVNDEGVYQTLPWNMRGWHCAMSGNDTHISFEICEPMGLTYNSNGSTIIGYNPPAGYFDKMWDNATDLCVMLCKKYGFDPLKNIICHSEGAQMGIASNHADVMHWFPHEGKNMNDFRKAVYTKMYGAKKDGYYNEGTQPSGWARSSFDKAIKKGIFLGDGQGDYTPKESITRESVAVILDRLNLLG